MCQSRGASIDEKLCQALPSYCLPWYKVVLRIKLGIQIQMFTLYQGFKFTPCRKVKNSCYIVQILVVPESLLLRIVSVTVPTYRLRGQPAHLECDYELGDNILYSVKWYRDNEEFYRYMPKFDPPKHAYKLDGVKVDVSINLLFLKH